MPCTSSMWKGSVATRGNAEPPVAGSADAVPEDATNRMRLAPSHVLGAKRQLASVVVLLLTLGCPFGLKGQVAVDSAPAVLGHLNRPITVFRASVLSRSPAERAAVAAATLNRFIEEDISPDVSTHESENMIVVSVSSRPLLVLVQQDVDSVSGETLDAKVADTVANLRRALDEAGELRTTPRMLRNAGELVLGIVFFTLLLLAARRLHAWLAFLLPMLAERKLATLSPGGVLVEESRATQLFARAIHVAYALAAIAIAFSFVTFSLRRFPYTRPLGESLRALLLGQAAAFGVRVLEALPDLFM